GAVWAHVVFLFHSRVVDSRAIAYSGDARGGGVFGEAGLSVTYSTISGNLAGSYGGGISIGGGAYVKGGVSYVYNSAIDSNRADYAAGLAQYDAHAQYGVQFATNIKDSTISGNAAIARFGGIVFHCGARDALGHCETSMSIKSSTVAFNAAPTFPGVWSDAP